ncbi:MAG: reverse transcriptase/maturase family protein, partial [Candidatus Binatia bacterium]
MKTMEDLVSDEVLNLAYEWLCQRRKNFPDDSDIWSLRRNWLSEQTRLRSELLGGAYRFGLLSRVKLKSGEEIDLWSARDALVLKCLSLVLAKKLSLSPRCAHVKGNGGSK